MFHHRFVRYADDCNIYVGSERAGKRVMGSIAGFITCRLKLKVNEAKSAVARPHDRKFLSFSFTFGTKPKRRIAPKALHRCKQKIRELTRRTRGISLPQMTKELATYLRGWKGSRILSVNAFTSINLPLRQAHYKQADNLRHDPQGRTSESSVCSHCQS